MKIMRWLTGVAAWAFGRAGGDGASRSASARAATSASTCPTARGCADYREALRRASVESWRRSESIEADQARGYARAEADVAAWLRATYSGRTRIADCVERGDHRPGDGSERCAGCGSATVDGRGYVLPTTDGYCDSCVEVGRRSGWFPRRPRDQGERCAGCGAGKWNVAARKDGGAVRVYRWGKLREELKPGKDTYDAPAGAMKFAVELRRELTKSFSPAGPCNVTSIYCGSCAEAAHQMEANDRRSAAKADAATLGL